MTTEFSSVIYEYSRRNRTDDDLYGVIAANELRIHRLEALLRQAAQYVGMVRFRPGLPQYTTDAARDLLIEIEAVLATSQHKKDAGDA